MIKPQDSLEIHDDLKKLLLKTREKRNFKVNEWIDQKTDMLNEYMSKSGLKGCVISVSGGVDSAVTLGLALVASKKKGSPIKKVLGVAQPIHSTGSIWKRALECETQMGAEIITVDQTSVFDSLSSIVDKAANIEGKSFARGQLKSYMRTPVGYYVAQLLSQEGLPSIVLGTGNKDEDGYLFYFCKAGDGVVDVQLIADLHKSEVFKVGEALKIPDSILKAKPSADLFEDQTDEGELGFSYDFIEIWTNYLAASKEEQEEMKKSCSEDAWKQFEEFGAKALQVHNRNKHKENYPHNINIL